MKKWITFLLAATLAATLTIGLCACGETTNDDVQSPDTETTEPFTVVGKTFECYDYSFEKASAEENTEDYSEFLTWYYVGSTLVFEENTYSWALAHASADSGPHTMTHPYSCTEESGYLQFDDGGYSFEIKNEIIYLYPNGTGELNGAAILFRVVTNPQ